MQAAAKATKVSLFIFLLITFYTNYFAITMTYWCRRLSFSFIAKTLLVFSV